MTTAIYPGRTKWEMAEDDDGHREYAIEFKIRADITDGPYNVRNTPGLPLPGSFWAQGSDLDPVAFCKRRTKIAPVQREDEATWLWRAAFIFSTKPDKRCQDFRFEDPLTEPPRISISWTKYQKEATEDRFQIPLRNSAFESLKGQQVEFDEGLATVKISQNLLLPQLDIINTMVHTLNSVPMWGLPIRCVKLSEVSFTKEYYGNCFPYWKRELGFDINPDTFDRDIADEGNKVLYGRWERPGVYRILCINGDVPDHKNPAHFKDFTFPDGNRGHTILNGKGLPAGVCVVWDECVAAGGLRGKMLDCPEDIEPALRALTTTGNYTPYYLSLWGNNEGNSLQDEDIWVNIVGSITPSEWVPFFIYSRGSLVTHNNKTWVGLNSSRGSEPGVGPAADGSNVYWLNLGSSTSTGTSPDHAIDNKNIYNPCTTYNLGDYVIENTAQGVLTGTGTGIDYSGCDKTRAAKIHIERYSETNFFILGIPAVL